MSWAEAVHLLGVLLDDPTSRLAVALAGWRYPLSWEGSILAGCFNLLAAQMKDPPKWPAPWPTAEQGEVRHSQEFINEQLRLMVGR